MTALAEEKAVETENRNEPRVTVSGVADLADGRGYLRLAGYRRGGGDLPLTAAPGRPYGLRPGDQVVATVRPAPAKTGKATTARASSASATLVTVESASGLTPEQARARPHFDQLTPLYPRERLRLEDGDPSPTARIIDLIAPIGKGQRGLIVAPPKAGKTTVLKTIAHALTVAHPEVHLMLVLVGERPEEATDLRRSVRGEVIASTFDQSPADHIRAAELAIERATRPPELGRVVVVMRDPLPRLARPYTPAAPASGRTLTGGVA